MSSRFVQMSSTANIPNLGETVETTLNSGDCDNIISWIRVRNHLYAIGTGGGDFRIMRMNKNDLATRTFNGFGLDPTYTPFDMVYSEARDRIYVVFGKPITGLKVVEVDPETLVMATVITDLDATYGFGASIDTDESKLYVVTFPSLPGTASTIISYVFGSWAKASLLLTGYLYASTVRYNAGSLYVYGATDGWLLKISTSLVIQNSLTSSLPAGGISISVDHLGFSSTHVYVGVAGLSTDSVYRCLKSDLSGFETIVTNITAFNISTESTTTHIWAAYDNGKLLRINTTTGEQNIFTLNAGEGFFGSLVFDPNYIFTVHYDTPSKITRYAIGPPQEAQFQWVNTNNLGDYGSGAIARDGSNNTYVLGYSSNGIRVDKYSSAGVKLWSIAYTLSIFRVGGICIDSANNVYITGTYTGSGFNIGGSVLPGFLGRYAVFVGKYSGSTGAHLWSRGFEGSFANSNYGYAIAVDSSNNPVVTGFCEGIINFGGGALTGAGLFVAKLATATGNQVWAKLYLGPKATGRGVSLDSSNNVFLTGNFLTTLDFLGPGPLTSPSYGIFVVKLDSTGNYVWQLGTGNMVTEHGFGSCITIAPNNELLFGGHFARTINFGGGNMTKNSDQNLDCYLVRMSNDGTTVIWQKHIQAAYILAWGVGVDLSGGCALTGQNASGFVDFGRGPVAGNSYIARYLSDGTNAWAKGYPTRQPGNGVVCDTVGNTIGCGSWYGDCDFGDGVRSMPRPNGYVLKLGL